MKRLISLATLGTLVFMINGCSQKENIVVPTKVIEKKEVFKSKILAKISNTPTVTYTLPYVQRSKYIKILILPFENSENDIDYGGIIETKLENSKFIFDDKLKKKIIKQNNMIGTL